MRVLVSVCVRERSVSESPRIAEQPTNRILIEFHSVTLALEMRARAARARSL
jgi:hypothetical protein